MKMLTKRFLQFVIGALILTIVFRYSLNLCIESERVFAAIICSIFYFLLMYLAGWFFGKKDDAENEILDIGFRYHSATYVLCVVFSYISYLIGWHTETLKAMTVTAISWGIGLLIHFICYLIERRKTIRGYVKEEIFQ